MKFRYKLIIEYDGTSYIGWQKQKIGASVQEVVEKAISGISGESVELVASGRTDAGVHALAQVAHFDLVRAKSAFRMLVGLNHYLRGTNVAVIKCEQVNNDFHSRFSARLRHYQYRIISRTAPLTLNKNRAWHIPHLLDFPAMEKAARHLIGQHDFSSFRDAECQAQSPIKTIENIVLFKEGDSIKINISAKSFLHHMVRNIVGTLVFVGRGKLKVEDMKIILEAKDRKKSGPNAPAGGLYFLGVDY